MCGYGSILLGRCYSDSAIPALTLTWEVTYCLGVVDAVDMTVTTPQFQRACSQSCYDYCSVFFVDIYSYSKL